jgi:hypothetical protein
MTDLNLTAFASPLATHACPNVIDWKGGIDTRRACGRAHADDLTLWCSECFDRYIAALRHGDDWMGGNDHAGRPVRGFAGHAESLDVINDALAEMEAFRPSAAQMAELRGATGGDGDHDGFLGADDRAMEALTVSDAAWAAENLDPETDFA